MRFLPFLLLLSPLLSADAAPAYTCDAAEFDRAYAGAHEAFRRGDDNAAGDHLWRVRACATVPAGERYSAIRGALYAIDGALKERVGDAKAAAEAYRLAVSHLTEGFASGFAGDPAFYEYRGRAHFARGAYKEAIADFAVALAEKDSPAEAKAAVHRLKGEAHLYSDEYAEAIAELDRAIALNEADSLAVYVRAKAHAFVGDNARAERDFAAAAAAFEAGKHKEWASEFYANRGVFHHTVGKSGQAIADLTKALEIDPKSVFALQSRGVVRYDMGDLAAARRDFDSAVALAPRGTARTSYRYLASISAQMGWDEEALAHYAQWIAADPQSPDGYVERGSFLHERGRFAQALADFDRAIALDPKRAATYLARASSHFFLGDLKKAESDLLAAQRLGEDSDHLHTQLGVLHEVRGNREEALRAYARAEQLARKALAEEATPYAKNSLAYALALQRRSLDEAERLAREARDGARGDASAVQAFSDTLGLVLHARGRHDEAAREISAALRQETRNRAWNVEMNYHLAMALQALGRKEEARAAVEASLAVAPEFPAARQLHRAITGSDAPSSTLAADAQATLEELRRAVANQDRAAMKSIAGRGAAAMPALLAALRDSDPVVRGVAAETLRRLGAGASDAAPALVVLLDDPDDRVREAAARTLEAIGPAAVPALHGKIEIAPPDSLAAISAVQILGAIRPPSSETLALLANLASTASISDVGESARGAAVSALVAHRGAGVPKLVEILEKNACSDLLASAAGGSGGVSARMTVALAKIGTAAVPKLVDTARGDSCAKFFAIRALRFTAIPPADAAAAAAVLAAALESRDEKIRAEAARALGGLPQATVAIPALRRLYERDSSAVVRIHAGAALARLDGDSTESVVRFLAARLEETRTSPESAAVAARWAAAEALGDIGYAANAAADALRAAASHDAAIAAAAKNALKRVTGVEK